MARDIEGTVPACAVPKPPLPKQEVDDAIRKSATKGADFRVDPEELKKKYRAERDKRLARGQGVEQYTLLDGPLSHYLEDPWTKAGEQREPIEESVDVVIVGGGFGAQSVAVRLVQAGVTNFRIVEKGGDFGGVWYWNRYPGAQCDTESYIYMPLLEEVGYMPSKKYAGTEELMRYSRMIGERFKLYDRALFQTEVKSHRWNEGSGAWTTSTSRGDTITSKFIVQAVGLLHRPKLPGVEGIEVFRGHSFHSSRWDFGYTGGNPSGNLSKLKDKRLGLIGTGATAVQIVPHLGKWAKQLYVFQRTPSSVDVRGNKATDEAWTRALEEGWQKKRMENFDSFIGGNLAQEDMVHDGWTDIMRDLATKNVDMGDRLAAGAQHQLADFRKMSEIRERCELLVHHKETAEALKPWYNHFCKRPCFHDEYLPTFNRPNVTLVDTEGAGVTRLTEKGVIANGVEYEVDCLVYATGFEFATDWSHRNGIEIYGRDGLTITEKWKDGCSTLHGWTSHGFPNCFWLQPIQAAVTPNALHVAGEQANHLAYVISECKKRAIHTVEPTLEAEANWVKTIVEGTAVRAQFAQECTPGFFNNEGKGSLAAARNSVYMPGVPAFLELLAEWRANGQLRGLDIRT
ncbi:hypothetical protein BDV95DRAFT_506755 [Massariosphaeria phaeospora]|uniref:FAD/NAD(P)-binding domain-containing protein n=1 Tax=Massariosphaeria phaeospora TaxID=100035 RepID=A0A7C8MF92_9PLEO|nr:hypothetical protein BDV95DRAFT_506755 [Massariosphaeria phaeospora]